MADIINTKAMNGLGAPLTFGVDLGTTWSTQTESYSGTSLGLSFTADKKLPFNSPRFIFQNDKGEPLFVSGIALGFGFSPTFNLIRDETQTGIFAVATEVPLEFRMPIPLGNSALVVLYAKPKATFSASEAPPAAVEGVTPDPTAEVHLVPTAAGAFTLTTGAAFYIAQPKDGEEKKVVSNPFFDVNVTYAPLNLIDGAYTFTDVFGPDSTIPKTEWSFTLQPPAAWFGNVAGFKINHKFTSAAREVKDADGNVVTDYRDLDHNLSLAGVLPFFNGSKMALKVSRAWTEDTGVESYHYGSGNGYGQTWSGTATLKAGDFWKVYGGKRGLNISVDQAFLESYERLTDQVPVEVSVGFSQKEQEYSSEGEYLYEDDAPVLDADGAPIPYDGSATFYDLAHLPNSDPSINDGLSRTLTFGFKVAAPVGPGALTTTVSLPFNVSPGAEDEDFLQRFRDPTGNNHTIAIAYEMPLGGGDSRSAKVTANSIITRVNSEMDFIREDLTRPSGKYKFTADQAYSARDILRDYMVAKDTNWTDLQKEYEGLVKEDEVLTMADFIIILEWCNETGRAIGSFKEEAKLQNLALHAFAQKWKAEKK